MTPPRPITGRDLALVLRIVQEHHRPLDDDELAAIAKLDRLGSHLLATELDVGVTGGLLARIEVTAIGSQAELVACSRIGDKIASAGHLIHRDLLVDPRGRDLVAHDVVATAAGKLTEALDRWARA